LATAATAALMLNGCSGADGKNGQDAVSVPAQTTGTVNSSNLTADDLKNTALSGKILSASIPGNQPVVKFQVVNKTTGKGVAGLRTFSLHVAQLQPELNGSSSYWQNYIADGLPLTAMPAASAAPTNPSTDAVTSFNADGTVKAQGYSVVDNGDGTYSVTFGANIKANTKVPYDPTLVHRIAIGVRSIVVPGVVGLTPGAYAGPLNPTTGAVMGQFVNTSGTAFVYDFVPATGAMVTDANGNQAFARDIVTIAACNQCHYRLEFGSNNTSGHLGSRPETKVCVVCHTNQLAGGPGNFTNFIHQLHLGAELPVPVNPIPALVSQDFGYPQDMRNCDFCHQGADGKNWMSKPTINACGSCHNGINWTTGTGTSNSGLTTGHIGGGQTDNTRCILCHGSTAVSAYHLPIAKPDPASSISVYAGAPYYGVFSAYSAAYQANGRVPTGNPNANTNAAFTAAASLKRLPAGAKLISYVIDEVGRNASSQPYMTFKFQIATADASGVLGTPSDVVFNTSNGTNEMITGFVGSPSVYFAFAVPQDGIAKPVDYNGSASAYLKRIWNGTAASVGQATQAGTLAAAAKAGYYTVTLTGVTIPDSAVMLTGGLGYTYGLGNAMTKIGSTYVPFGTTTQPLTQIDLPAFAYTPVAGTPIGIGGLSVPADNKWKVATKGAPDKTTGTGVVTANAYTGRRVIVDNAKCNACHGRLGVKPTFHAGQRNDAPTCTFCHNVNRTNSGWAVNIKEDVHAIHAGTNDPNRMIGALKAPLSGKRVNRFSWEATAGATYWNVGFPTSGAIKNCEMCHVPGMYDFSASAYIGANSGIFDSMLFTTDASGTISASAFSIITGNETILSTDSVISPFVTPGAAYGGTFAFNAGTGATTAAASTTLVSSPISAACFSCHDSSLAKQHMIAEGGAIYEARSTAISKKELCIVCHGPLSTTNITNATSPTIKAVHRWW
jgi:OmcA/MtrC family decaheme c-type cytochrome